jgi:hypothetical protein
VNISIFVLSCKIKKKEMSRAWIDQTIAAILLVYTRIQSGNAPFRLY